MCHKNQSSTFVHDWVFQVDFDKWKKITIHFKLDTLKSLRSRYDRKAIMVLLLRNTDTFIQSQIIHPQ